MASIFFSFPIEPTGKARPRVIQRNGRAIAYTPKETKKAERIVRDYAFWQMRQDGFEIVKAPQAVKAAIIATFAVPPSYSMKRRAKCLAGLETPTKKPDTDNIAKLILDALNGLAYDDDSQVIQLSVTKVYGERAKVDLMLATQDS